VIRVHRATHRRFQLLEERMVTEGLVHSTRRGQTGS
jgi:hypothetical protein